MGTMRPIPPTAKAYTAGKERDGRRASAPSASEAKKAPKARIVKGEMRSGKTRRVTPADGCKKATAALRPTPTTKIQTRVWSQDGDEGSSRRAGRTRTNSTIPATATT